MSFKPTKAGDGGFTRFGGDRIAKSSPEIHLVGQFDSLQANIGELHSMFREMRGPWLDEWFRPREYEKIIMIQEVCYDAMVEIYDILSCLHNGEKYQYFDELMDATLKSMPFDQHKNFMLPIFDMLSAKINLVRTKVREVELLCQDSELDQVRAYLNRLSSVFYAALCYYNDNTKMTTIRKN
jgi:cob(I)alamin adenosyltransferase